MEKRTVRIKRHNKNSEYLPDEVVAESKVNLASIFDSSGQPLSGLSREEEKELLPQFINEYPESRDFNKKRNEFWAEKVEKVPSGGGLILDISTDESGYPHNPKDYITYKWAQKHKMVADSKEEAESSPMKWFYLYDPREELSKQSSDLENMQLAWQEFIQMKDDIDKLKLMARVFCNTRPEKLTEERLKLTIKDALEEDPKGFVKVAQDKDLERESMILEMVEYNIIRKIGNQFMYMDQVIGDSMDEAIAYIKNKKNSGEVSTMKAKLKEARS